jgi:hypothetical protein
MHKYRITWNEEVGRQFDLYADRMFVEDRLLKFTIDDELVYVCEVEGHSAQRIETDWELTERQREDNARHFTFVRGERPPLPADPFEWIRGEVRTEMLDTDVRVETDPFVDQEGRITEPVEEWYEE